MSYRDLINATLEALSDESVILAESEDAGYFRSIAKSIPHKKIATLEKFSHIPPVQKLSPTEDLPKKEDLQEASKINFQSSTPDIKNSSLTISPLKPIFKKVFPEIQILDDLPCDQMAKKIANRWKAKNQVAPISILSYLENPKQKQFLEEISKAVDIYFGPAQLIHVAEIEKEKQWDAFLSSKELKLIIACDYTLWQLNDLMIHYKENPAKQLRTLKETPLFLLPDLSLYLKDPLLKHSLWKALCKACHST